MSTEQSGEGISLIDFTKEFVALLVNALEANPDLRPSIDKLCDLELYSRLVNLTHVEYAVMATDLTLPDPLQGQFQELLRRADHNESYLRMRDWNRFRSGSIAVALREALGYDPDADMGDEGARETCNMYMEHP
jgi:hypothetical protein